MKRFSSALLVLAVVSGCATAPKATQFEKTTYLAHPFDAVWTAVISTFAEKTWAIDNLAKDSGLITTDWLALTYQDGRRFCDCGKDLMGTPRTGGSVKFNVFVQPSGDRTSVQVNCTFRSMKLEGETPCFSKGVLEAELQELLKEKLGP